MSAKTLSKSYKHVILLITALMFVAIFGLTSSPLTAGSWSDSSMWHGIADYWSKGAIPHKELFDNKGPVLHFIYMTGDILPGKWGVYLLESLFLFVTLELFTLIGKELGSSKGRTIAALLCVMWIFAYTISDGGTNEEWCLTLSLYPLFEGIRYLNGKRLKNIAGIISGICFSLIFFIRLNNTVIIAAVVATLIITMSVKKEYRMMGRLTLSFITGVAIGALPICLYFAYHGALGDVLYNTIIFNIDYKAKWGGDNYLSNAVRLSTCVLLIIVTICADKETRHKYLLLVSTLSVFVFLTFIGGRLLPLLHLCTADSISKRDFPQISE